MDYANENTTIICQIESQEGLDHLEDIATTMGVDVLWVGQFDLSHSLGIAGQFQHPKPVDALKLVVDTADKHDLVACIQPGNMAQVREWIEIGFKAISYSGDLFLYVDALTEAVADVRKLAGGS
jgi:2-keto-3-deoxy-L-rhamnonate aldolase RhmA